MSTLSKTPHRIQSMFSSIAHRYDLLNRLLSFGRDRYWREFAVTQMSTTGAGTFLDVATGTGDVAIEIIRQFSSGTRVIGIDFSRKMLQLGQKKVTEMDYQDQIELRYGDVTSLSFEDKTFDAAIIAFGIRNISDYQTGLRELARVVKEGGKIVILEFASVQDRFFGRFIRLYLQHLLPTLGGIISGEKSAYQYLSDSVMDFPQAEQFKHIMEDAGIRDVLYYRLTFGIVTVHVGHR